MRHDCLKIAIVLIIAVLTAPTWAENEKNLCSTDSDCKTCLDQDGKEDPTKKPICIQIKFLCECVPKKNKNNHSSTDANPDIAIPTGPD